MMVSPYSYAEMYKDATYEELLKVRNKLIEELWQFERNEVPAEEYMICPSPDTRYSCNLEYMTEICRLVDAAYQRKRLLEEEEQDRAVLEEEDRLEELRRKN